jgi:hypothetical protein
LTAHDSAAHGCVADHRRNELVGETLMIALGVIVRCEFTDKLTQVPFTQRYNVSQAVVCHRCSEAHAASRL